MSTRQSELGATQFGVALCKNILHSEIAPRVRPVVRTGVSHSSQWKEGSPENVCSSREDSTSIPYPCPNRSGRGVRNTPLCKPRKGREKKNLPTYLMDDLFDGTMGMDYYYGYRLSQTGIHLDTLRQNHEILFQIQTGLFKTVSSRRDSNWPN